MKQFIEKLVGVLDTEQELNADVILADLEEWESLSMVAFMAMANVAYGKKVSPDDVKNAKTVADLYNLVK